MRRPGLLLTICSVLSAACSHSEPFPPADYRTDLPFDPGPPVRITANRGNDGEISFTPDGQFLLYTVGACIAFLPAHEGRDSELLCAPPIQFHSDRLGHATLSASDRLAFLLTRSRDFEVGPYYKAVMVAPLADIRDTSEIIPVPFVTTVDGILHLDITRLAWLRGDTLAILADGVVYLTDPASTVRPRVFVPLSLPGPVYSMQPASGGSVLYLRVEGDSRVLVRDPAAGGITTFYDFGFADTGLIAVGTRHLTVVTAGALLRINLQDGRTVTVPTFNLVIAELTMTPDGSDIIASAVDTTGLAPPGGRTTDLYRLNP